MAKSKIKVSIIIPVYNVEKYLQKCIESVLAQTLIEIEIFLVDDGSIDGSWNIIQKFAEKDTRIIAIKQDNAGAAVARNAGLERAKGEYIGFVDSDDYVDADYFEQLYKAANEQGADVARAYVKSEIETSDDYQMTHTEEGYDNYYNVKLKKVVLRNKLNLTSSNWLAIYKQSMLVKNEIKFIPEIRTGQDNIFNLHVSYVANKVVFVGSRTYYHMVRRDGSLMTNYNFTSEGLISRTLVIKETVRYLNTIENYDRLVYVARVKDVFDFFHSRLVKTTGITAQARKRLVSILLSSWKDVRYKGDISVLLRHDARFVAALSNEKELDQYIRYIVPARRRLSSLERKRQMLKTRISQNKVAYKALRPTVKTLRKINNLATKVLS